MVCLEAVLAYLSLCGLTWTPALTKHRRQLCGVSSACLGPCATAVTCSQEGPGAHLPGLRLGLSLGSPRTEGLPDSEPTGFLEFPGGGHTIGSPFPEGGVTLSGFCGEHASLPHVGWLCRVTAAVRAGVRQDGPVAGSGQEVQGYTCALNSA